jgi:hypothetical protein
MYRKFNSIGEAYEILKRELKKRGNLIHNPQSNKMVKELIGVTFKVPIDFFMTYYKERPENFELETVFNEALKNSFKNKSNSNGLASIQIIVRKKPTIVVYFRNLDIETLLFDFAVIARKTFLVFGEGEIIYFIGKLYLNL